MSTSWALALHLARRDFTDRFSGSALGSIWAFVQPLVMIFVFTVVFSELMRARMTGNDHQFAYGVYLMAGMLPWTAFQNTVVRSATVFSDRKALLSKMPVSLTMLPVTVALSETITCATALGLLAIVLPLLGLPLSPWMLALPVIYAAWMLVACALGLLLATLAVFLKDLREIVSIGFTLLFWLTPIVYVPEVLPEVFRPWVAWNPLTHMVTTYQGAFLNGTAPDLTVLLIVIAVGLVLLAVARWLLRLVERDVRDLL
jgi:lipopolysaccharide transport system permease protein